LVSARKVLALHTSGQRESEIEVTKNLDGRIEVAAEHDDLRDRVHVARVQVQRLRALDESP